MLAAEDPLASAHHFQIVMGVVVPSIFGIRMCFMCPHCNTDDCGLDTVFTSDGGPCSNCFGCNQKLMGGYAGLATALAFLVGYTKDGSPHAHGLVSLTNLYSTNSLLGYRGNVEDQQSNRKQGLCENSCRVCEPFAEIHTF